MRILSAFESQLRVDNTRGRATLIDTTGDRRDNERSLLLPKNGAALGTDAEGKKFVEVATSQEKTEWVPLDAFQQTEGDDGLLYLPTFKDSPLSATIGGALKGVVALGPIGGLSGAVAGAATILGESRGKFTKLALGATAGAVAMGVANSALYGLAGLPVTLLLGAVTGAASVQAGEGQASVRDASYGGTVVGFAATLLTGMPLTLLTGSVSAGLGARANSKIGRTATAALVGAALQAGQAYLGGGSLPLALAIGGAVGAAGTLLGPPLMQVTRNLSQAGGQVLREKLKGAPDAALIALGSVPLAATGGFIGAAVSTVLPGWGSVAAVVGATAGAAFGAYQTHRQIAAMKAKIG